MIIIYRKKNELYYPRLIWSRFEAWQHAEKHGGYERDHKEEFWGYTYEPEKAKKLRKKYSWLRHGLPYKTYNKRYSWRDLKDS